MRRTAPAVIGLILACLGAEALRAQVSGPTPALAAESQLGRTVAETQEALRTLANETGGFVVQKAAPAPHDDDLRHGGGIIRGHITEAATAAPVPGATVTALLTSLTASPVTTITDSDGAFEFRGLTPGRWRLDATRSGFITRSFGQRTGSARVGTVTLRDRAVARADIALVRGGVITGRILDGFGEPAVDAFVQVMHGKQLLVNGVSDVTDDRGAFRVYNLSPGDYLVTARPMQSTPRVTISGHVIGTSGTGLLRSIDGSRLPTYFPGTPELGAAERITLGAGEERAGVDFTLSRAAPIRISGRILDSSGERPARGVSVSLLLDAPDTVSMFMASSAIAISGTFEFTEVLPGRYIVAASAGTRDGRTEIAEMSITVGSEDIPNLTIVTAPGPTLTGTVIGSHGSVPDLRGTMVDAMPVGGRLMSFARMSVNVIDGTFRIPNLPGAFRLDLRGVPEGWSVQSIEVDGRDVTDVPATSASGQPQATVTLTNRLTDLRGIVTHDRKPIEAEVAVFVDDPAKWASQRFVREIPADERGIFSVRGLPAHDRYLAVAIDNLEPGDLQDVEFLERLRSHAVPFSLDEEQPRSLSLTLVARSVIDER